MQLIKKIFPSNINLSSEHNMPKFNPAEFGYELVHEEDAVLHFQKIILKKDCVFTDIIELSYLSKLDRWILFIKTANLKQFLPDTTDLIQDNPITLFIGELKNDFDFRFIISKIIKEPKLLIQMGS